MVCLKEMQQKQMSSLFEILQKCCGWGSKEILLVGFAQGGTFALDYLFSKNQSEHVGLIIGVIGISTALLAARCRALKQNPTISKSILQIPILLIHGEKDDQISPQQSKETQNSLKLCGFENVCYNMFKNRGHGMLRGDNYDECRVFMEFLATHLNGMGKKKDAKAMKDMSKKLDLIECAVR